MTTLSSQLAKPHFIFRPRQVVGRLRHLRSAGEPRECQVSLPWGVRIDCLRDESIGSSLARTGIYDLPVTEALARLVDTGDLVIDAGANIGYTTSLMAWRAGPAGAVLSFEPNPAVLPLLEGNARRWAAQRALASITVLPVALSDQEGLATLRAKAGFDRNMGTASLSEHSAEDATHSWRVQTRRLDGYVRHRPVSVLKLDVEDHELSVLRGASESIAARRIRDILLEDRTAGSSPTFDLLRAAGYEMFAIDQGLLGLRVTGASRVAAPREAYDPPTFLATADANRALERLGGVGWRSLNPRLFSRRLA